MQITPEPTAPGRLVAAKLFNSDGSQAVCRSASTEGRRHLNQSHGKQGLS